MSIDALWGDKNFKHRIQDDMESFYYVTLYASVLWLPHENSEDVEVEMATFFDEYKERNGKAHGGIAKESNRASGRFHRLWGFKNDSLKIWLEDVRKLQWKNWDDGQPKWTPQRLNGIWKTLDDGDLPVDDRTVHVLPQVAKEDSRKTEISTSNAVQGQNIALPEPESRSTDAASRASSKRSAEEASFEERSDSSKRYCRSGCVSNPRDDRLKRSC